MIAKPQRYASASSARIARLLTLLGSRPGHRWTVSELHFATDWPLTSVRRHLATLVETRFAHRNPDGRYSLGSEVWLLQNEPHLLDLLIEATFESLVSLRQSSGETAQLAVLDGTEAVYLAQELSRSPLLAQVPYGDRCAAYCSASGRAMLASLTHIDRERFISGDATEAELAAIHAQLDVAKHRGYATDRNEIGPGVSGLAVPLPNVFRLAAISITLPTERFSAEQESTLSKQLLQAARTAADQLAAHRAARLWEFHSNTPLGSDDSAH